jgi:hypothetical protein
LLPLLRNHHHHQLYEDLMLNLIHQHNLDLKCLKLQHQHYLHLPNHLHLQNHQKVLKLHCYCLRHHLLMK